MDSLRHTVGLRLNRDLTWRPTQTSYEMRVSVLYGSNAASILSEIPTSYSLVVCRREQILAAWMENERSNPIIVTGLPS